jgi:two-component system sensor histidine kinase FlrB
MQLLLSEVKVGSDAMMLMYDSELLVELPDPDIEIMGNKTALASAIGNLIHNSIQIIGRNAKVVLKAEQDLECQNFVSISVTDNGPGVDLAIADKLFEPFFTTKSQGTGLGLAVVSSVANAHQGRVKVSNSPQGGACFSIHLPIFAESNVIDDLTLESNNRTFREAV